MIYNFELDPATDGTNSLCDFYYDESDDALICDWDMTTFCNPPYSKITKWVKKAHDENLKHGNKIVLLIPARTDTRYWHDYIFNKAKIIFIKGRLSFYNPKEPDITTSATFPSAIVVYGEGIGITTITRDEMRGK